jgi:plasmid stabilization system protein ParE
LNGFRFSHRARDDLRALTVFTRDKWGEAQVLIYVGGLRRFVRRISESESLGRPIPALRPGLFRAHFGSHVVLFRRPPHDSLLVCRILHKSQLAGLHPIDDTDPD